jgi:hypothetical protein
MADLGTFSTAAEAVSKATCSAFKNILVDMFVTGPSETAGIVTADNVEG